MNPIFFFFHYRMNDSIKKKDKKKLINVDASEVNADF